MIHSSVKNKLLMFVFLLVPAILMAQDNTDLKAPDGSGVGALSLAILLLSITFVAAIYLAVKTSSLISQVKKKNQVSGEKTLDQIVNSLSEENINTYLKHGQMKKNTENKSGGIGSSLPAWFLVALLSLAGNAAFAQTAPGGKSLLNDGGIIITLILITTPILVGIILMIIKVRNISKRVKANKENAESERISNYLKSLPEEEVTEALLRRKEVLDYSIAQNALSGNFEPEDKRGILKNINEHANIRFIEEKRKALSRPNVDPELSKLVIWFLIWATVWLVFGTTVGEYEGIKFVAPDADQISWLSFGRLRPVHTNAVFWGWSSLAMLGLAYYVVPRVGNNKLWSLKLGWWTLWLINAAVFFGLA